jgi:hypothetical protein
LGAQYLQNSGVPPENQAVTYQFPKSLASDYFAFSGVWTDHSQEATAGRRAKLELRYEAQDVYLVMGGSGTVTISDGIGTAAETIHVEGVPRLYTLFQAKSTSVGTLVMKVSKGVEAYEFTFG